MMTYEGSSDLPMHSPELNLLHTLVELVVLGSRQLFRSVSRLLVPVCRSPMTCMRVMPLRGTGGRSLAGLLSTSKSDGSSSGPAGSSPCPCPCPPVLNKIWGRRRSQGRSVGASLLSIWGGGAMEARASSVCRAQVMQGPRPGEGPPQQ